jgi:hypothetical protein
MEREITGIVRHGPRTESRLHRKTTREIYLQIPQITTGTCTKTNSWAYPYINLMSVGICMDVRLPSVHLSLIYQWPALMRRGACIRGQNSADSRGYMIRCALRRWETEIQRAVRNELVGIDSVVHRRAFKVNHGRCDLSKRCRPVLFGQPGLRLWCCVRTH